MLVPDDRIDACGAAGEHCDTTTDADVDALVLFADVDFDNPAEVAARVAAYEELFGDA